MPGLRRAARLGISGIMANKIKTKDLTGFYGDPDYIAQGILTSDFVFDPGGKGLEGGAFTLRSWRDDFYHWQDGCWVRLSDAEMKRKATGHIQALNDKMQDESQQISISMHRINNILLCLKGRIGVSEAVELNTWDDGRDKLMHTISFNNGLLCLGHKKLKPTLIGHTPHYFGLTKLPFDYNPDAQCPEWIEFLDEVMQGKTEYLLLLQQFMGYLFRPDLQEQKFLLCVGEGANGKGVFFDVVEATIGEENCSHVSLSQFHRPFAAYATLGKIANLTNESSHLIEDEAENVLKTLVAGDRTEFARKFKEDVQAKPTAKFLIATNALPRFNDKTMGIWRRILLVPFDKVIAEDAQIKDLAKQLKRELPGILNWAIVGLQKLNEAGGFTMPENSKQLIEEYRKDSDPARAFLLENYEYNGDGYGVSCTELYSSYKQYCDENGCRTMNNRTFGRQVWRIFPDIERSRPGNRDSREWVYQGLVSQVS